MTDRRKFGRLRTLASLFKPAGVPRAARAAITGVFTGFLAILPACRFLLPPRRIALADLEAAPSRPTAQRQQLLVSDYNALRSLCTPLSPRLALLQIRSARDWERLRRVAPIAGECPDLRGGAMVGLVSLAGTPLDGQWPVMLEAVRVHGGGGLLEASFRDGTFWPDGTAYVEVTYVPGLYTVLVVDVNGTTFYPSLEP